MKGKELPQGWINVKFTDVLDIKGGTQPPKSEFINEPKEGYIRLLQIRDFGKRPVPTYIPLNPNMITCNKDDILIARYGASIGRIVSGQHGAYNVALAKVIIPDSIAPLYVKFLLKSNIFQIPILSIQRTAQNGFNKNDLSGITIPLPPLPEQERIAAKLDKAFTNIEVLKSKLEQIPELLKQFRQTVLTHAVTGKLTEEWRKGRKLENIDFIRVVEEEISALNKRQKIENKSTIKQNPITYLSKGKNGWSYYTLESLCIAIVDCLHETAKFSTKGFCIIDTNNIEPFQINFNKIRYVENQVYKKWVSRLSPEKGDIAFTREGTIGNAVRIPENNKFCIGQRTVLFRFSSLLNSEFCEIYLNSESFKRKILPLIKGVASQHVNIRDIRRIEYPFPSLEEQNEIVQRVNDLLMPTNTIKIKYQAVREKINKLPQALLSKAFKGELVRQMSIDIDARDLLFATDKLPDFLQVAEEQEAYKKRAKSKNKSPMESK